MKFGTDLSLKKLFLLGASAWAINCAAYAQETPDEDTTSTLEVIEEETEEDEAVQERIVVTGSRIQRSEFTSTSPVQILQADVSRAVGLVSAADILQNSTANSGLRIDATFNGFVLDNGPGASEVNLRGLGAGRTLLLVNNRRISPAGVEGAPGSPDLNLIPGILLDRIEVLLDGASSIYGADAVSGVANAVLRNDLEGFEVQGEISLPFEPGGEDYTIAAAWGATTDNGYFGFGAEYNNRRRVRFADRDAVSLCEEELFSNRTDDDPAVGTLQNCELSLRNRIFIQTGFGSIYYTPGSSNTGIPNFTESQLELFGVPFDNDGNGEPDVDIFDPFYNFNASAREQAADFVSPLERYSVYAYGENDIGDTGNSVFFEALYSNRTSTSNGGPSVIFPTVPGDNPFNPCNENAPGGVNCLGIFGVNFGNQDVVPIIGIVDDREVVSADVAQSRFVGGIRGDLDFLGNFGLDNWTYEASAQYSRSSGQSKREGIINDRLLLSLNTSVVDPATGNIVCGIDIDGDGLPDSNEQIGVFGDEDLLSVPCVPVNLFAPSVFQSGGGRLATQAETDYIFGTRNFNTVIDQTIYQGIVQGDLFELPWNGSKVPLVLGFEYRDESIFSDPDTAARDGLLIAFFADRGASGRRDLYEAFAETEITPIRGETLAEELTFNLSTRWTEEENFGALWTYSLKGKYRPVDWLAINATTGTSYRAPDLRQQFLAGATGFNTFSDPCVVPDIARISQGPGADPTYDPTADPRSQITLDNCAQDGVDPTSLGLVGNVSAQQSVEIITGGTQDLLAEESESFTVGFTVEQPWFDAFDLSINLNYYDTEITDAVAEPGPAFIIRDCFVDNPNLGSAFCSRIGRSDGGFISTVDASFLNIGLETAKGFDLNLLYQQEFIIAERPLDVSFDLRVNKTEERILDLSNTLAPGATPEEIEASIDDNVGEPEFPEWRWNATLIGDYRDFRGVWQARFIAGGQDDRADTFDPTAQNVIDFTDDYIIHNISVTYNPGSWALTVGVENVFDEFPNRVDDDGTFSVRNFPVGVGYDPFGRRAFVQASKEF